jgi:predicted component of type VI protein secretion system
MPINAKLVVVGGEVKTAEIKLRLPCTIGRGRSSTIVLPQALVSRQHCELFESSGKLMVRDLGSLNGTLVNGQKIAEPTPVNSEELLTIGSVTYRVVMDGDGASTAAAGPDPVHKSSARDTLPVVKAAPVAMKIPTPVPLHTDDSSEPLEIGDFEFGESTRPGSAADSPVPAAANLTFPTAPLAMPIAAIAKPMMPTPLPAAAPAATAPTSEEVAEQEDDFQDFLKSLGK